jgi:hypothetical protein
MNIWFTCNVLFDFNGENNIAVWDLSSPFFVFEICK